MSRSRVYRSKLYKEWFKTLGLKDQGVVDTRIDSYIENGFLINSKLLDSEFCLYEFKWKNGIRVYYSFIEDQDGKLMLLLLGGNKNSQSRDIVRAKNIILKAIDSIKKKNKLRSL